jgi:hypothetical protein
VEQTFKIILTKNNCRYISNIKFGASQKGMEFKASVLLFEDLKPVKSRENYIQWYGWLAEKIAVKK